MANNFADDARVIDFWRFENNLTAGKAGNDLTASAGGVGYESASPMEGAYSLSLARASAQYASRADADLSADFPLKDGDADKKGMWFCRLKPTVVNLQYQLILSKAASTARGLQIHLGYDDLVIWWGYSGSSYRIWTVVADIFSAGGEYSIGIIFDGVNKTCTVRLYDHDTDTATTYENTFTDEMRTNTIPFYVGIAGGSTNYFGGLVDEVVAAVGDWTVGEIDSIRAGTFGTATSLTVGNLSSSNALGSPALTQIHTLVVQSASHTHVAGEPVLQLGATNLITADMAHGHALEGPVLTQKHNISIANSSHAQTFDNPALTRIIDLVTAGLMHGNNLSAPVLTQLHSLVAANLAHAHPLGAPALTQEHNLAVDNAAHSQALNTPALIQLHQLAANNLAHSQEVGSPILTQEHELITQNLNHSHDLGAVNLSQEQNLTVGSLENSHNIEVPVLTQAHTIAVQNLVHANELGSLSLTQLHELAVANAAHIMSLDAPALTRIVILAIQNATMGQELGSLSLTQLHSLAIQNALKANTLTSPVLTQLHNIIVNALAHLNTLEAPILVHIGEILFTKGSYAALPADNVNLDVDYTEQNVLDVASDNETRVGQITYGDYALHQFKKLVAGNKATIKSNVRSNIAGGDSPIYLQVYNHDLDTWETIDSDSTTGADTDFNLEAVIADLANYKDPANLVSCRVYQEAQ